MKRGGGKVRGDSVFLTPQGGSRDGGFDQLPDHKRVDLPVLVEQVRELLARLDQRGDRRLRLIALGKMEGKTNEDLAAELHCAEKTVERKLKVIRHLWEKELSS